MGAQLLSDLLLSLCSNVFGVGSDSGVAIDHPGGLHAAASKHLKSITAIRSYQPGKVQYGRSVRSVRLFPARYQRQAKAQHRRSVRYVRLFPARCTIEWPSYLLVKYLVYICVMLDVQCTCYYCTTTTTASSDSIRGSTFSCWFPSQKNGPNPAPSACGIEECTRMHAHMHSHVLARTTTT